MCVSALGRGAACGLTAGNRQAAGGGAQPGLPGGPARLAGGRGRGGDAVVPDLAEAVPQTVPAVL